MKRLILVALMFVHAAASAEEIHHYLVVNPDAYDFAVGRFTKGSYHAARAGSALVKAVATVVLGNEVIHSATPLAQWAPLAWAFFVPDVSRWNAARLESRLARARGPVATTANGSLAVEKIVVLKGARYEAMKSVPQTLKGAELVYLQTKGPLPAEWLASKAWGGQPPVAVADPAAVKIHGELVIDGKPVGVPWTIGLAELAANTPIPEAVAGPWRDAIRASDALEPYALVRWWNQLPVSPFDRIRIEASVELPNGARQPLGMILREEGVRKSLEMGFRAKLRSAVGLGGPGSFPAEFRKGRVPCRVGYAEIP